MINEIDSFGRFLPSHAMSNTPTYHCWEAMKQRCLNKKDKGYKNYGGRGIEICPEWINSFDTFFKDMGKIPNKYQLDRIDNNKGYSKENCKWSSKVEQAQNRRTSKRWIIEGIEYVSALFAAKKFNCSESTIIRWCEGYVTRQNNFIPPKDNCSSYKLYGELNNGC